MLLVVLLGLWALPAVAHVQFGAYNKTCPQAEELVLKEMTAILAKSADLAGALPRLFSVVGCEGSILLDSTANSMAEKDSPLNKGVRGYEFIDSLMAKLDAVLSGADTIGAHSSGGVLQRVSRRRGGVGPEQRRHG